MKRSDIYKALRDLAKTELVYLKFVDLQKGQMQAQKQNYPVPLPALFIELGDFKFSNLDETDQIGNGIISTYLYVDSGSDTFNGSEREDASLAILDKFDDIYQTFEGFSIENLTPLNRSAEYKPQYGEKIILFRVDFSTSVEDQKLIERKTTAKPEPDIIPKYKFKG
jgi:hypothetical protein